MPRTHDELVKQAKEAIDAVFSDQSVSKKQNRESLEELAAEVESALDALGEEE